MNRMSYLTVAEMYRLNTACRPLWNAFDYGVYLVGSALIRKDYRDVDLRCIMPDADFKKMFPKKHTGRLAFLNATVSQWVAAASGLPIDFQFQSMSEANSGEHEGRRHAIGMAPLGAQQS